MYPKHPQFFQRSQNSLYGKLPPLYSPPVYNQPVFTRPLQTMTPVMPPLCMSTPTPLVQESTIIIIDDSKSPSGLYCLMCAQDTEQIQRKAVGCVTMAWAGALFMLTGVCCFLPFLMDRCKNTQLVCVKCHAVKNTIPAQCL